SVIELHLTTASDRRRFADGYCAAPSRICVRAPFGIAVQWDSIESFRGLETRRFAGMAFPLRKCGDIGQVGQTLPTCRYEAVGGIIRTPSNSAPCAISSGWHPVWFTVVHIFRESRHGCH